MGLQNCAGKGTEPVVQALQPAGLEELLARISNDLGNALMILQGQVSLNGLIPFPPLLVDLSHFGIGSDEAR